MIPIENCVAVPADAPLAEAINALSQGLATPECHRQVLVTDGDGNPVGLLTTRDLIEAVDPRMVAPGVLPESITRMIEAADPMWYTEGQFTSRCRSQAPRKVRDLADKLDPPSVTADAPLLRAVRLMVKNNCRALPVLDGGRPVGIIGSNELFREIAAAMSASR